MAIELPEDIKKLVDNPQPSSGILPYPIYVVGSDPKAQATLEERIKKIEDALRKPLI